MKLSKDHGNGRVLYDWWHDVTQARDKGADRAARAILRRAHDITAVTLSQPYQHLKCFCLCIALPALLL